MATHASVQITARYDLQPDKAKGNAVESVKQLSYTGLERHLKSSALKSRLKVSPSFTRCLSTV